MNNNSVTLNELIDWLKTKQYISTSAFQREFCISYPKAKELLNILIDSNYVDDTQTCKGYKVMHEKVLW